MKVNRIQEFVERYLKAYKVNFPGYKYYFGGADSQERVYKCYHAESIKDLFDEMEDENVLNFGKLEEYLSYDEVNNRNYLKINEEEMLEVIRNYSDYYYMKFDVKLS